VQFGLARLFALGLTSSTAELINPANESVHTSAVIPLHLKLNAFQPGRDGQCCLVYKGKDILCFIRPDIVPILTIPKEYMVRNGVLRKLIHLDIELRGNVFFDRIYMIQYSINLEIGYHQFDDIDTELQAAIAHSGTAGHVVVPLRQL
jgi:hypothetical protein